jgi:uncharacterized protein (TIGR02452 family)
VARETMSILAAGHYTSARGTRVDIGSSVRACVQNSRLFPAHSPVDVGPGRGSMCRIEVTGETVFDACRRLSRSHDQIAVLNFASATKPGGGFLNGAQAQEEAIARASALFPSIERHPEMYRRGAETPLYSDSMIYSPGVPYFRDDSGRLIEDPFNVSMITAAAPNASECRGHERARIEPVMKNRMRRIMALAAQQKNRVLVLGAFGCGVFGNDPQQVARIQRELLVDEGLGRHFDVVVNPVPAGKNLAAFRQVLQ